MDHYGMMGVWCLYKFFSVGVFVWECGVVWCVCWNQSALIVQLRLGELFVLAHQFGQIVGDGNVELVNRAAAEVGASGRERLEVDQWIRSVFRCQMFGLSLL